MNISKSRLIQIIKEEVENMRSVSEELQELQEELD